MITKNTSISIIICGIFALFIVFTAGIYAIYTAFFSHDLYGGLLVSILLFGGWFLLIFRTAYFLYVKKCHYCPNSVHRITIAWLLYNSSYWIWFLCFLFGMLLLCAKYEEGGLSTNVWFLIILLVALIITLFSKIALRKEKKKREPILEDIILFYFPRIFLMFAFVIYYCIIYLMNSHFKVDEIIPALFVILLGFDRAIALVSELEKTMQDTYDSCYKDSDIWVRKRRKMDEA